jgi:tRNA(His) 5'-end guanylyltransferase
LTSVVFNRLMPKFDFPEDKVKQMPTFDSRVWNVPNLTEAANCFLWREKDATKNSVSMAAQAYFSYKELQNKSQSEMQEMLWSKKDINWNNYPDFFKRGTYAARRKVSRPYTTEELEMLSPKHAARTNPELLVERMAVVLLEMPPFVRVQNREEVLFQAQDFILAS